MIEHKEKFEHNFRHNGMGDGQKHNDKFSRIIYVKLALAKKKTKTPFITPTGKYAHMIMQQ